MDPVGDARQNFDVRFYLVAILFLVFDVELLYLYPWAVAAYNEKRGVPAALSTAVFVITILFLAKLTIGYIYEWRKGGFNWR
jgi:NADH:ubiquinone oxidoreductase subunit 3 (subunit A)